MNHHDKDLDYFLGISEAELEVIFGLEREIGTYGLKSKVFLGFLPRLHWSSFRIEEAKNREFHLKLELCCPSDVKSWKDVGIAYHYYSPLDPERSHYYYFMETPSELREFIKECPFVRNCEDSKIETALREIEIRAFWSKVIRKGL